MHVTKQQLSSAMDWLLDFLNLNFDSPTKTDRKRVDDFLISAIPHYDSKEALSLQTKWIRTLLFFVQDQSLFDSFAIGITIYDGLIRTEGKFISKRAEEIRKEGRDPKGDKKASEEMARHRRYLQQLKKDQATMQRHKKRGREWVKKNADQIQKDLKGALWSTREKALKFLIADLNGWSINKKILLKWRLIDANESGDYPEPGQGVLRIETKKFVVDRWHDTHGLDDLAYSVIAKCLETGELARLRKCLYEECGRYFFAHHLRKFYCSPKCQKLNDNRAAPQRVKESRKRQAQHIEERGLASLTTLARSIGAANKRRDEAASKLRDLDLVDLLQSIPLLKKVMLVLGEQSDVLDREVEAMKNGASVKEVWGRLSPRVEKCLAEVNV